MAERIYLFDTTLRDGQQTQGVDFSVADKQAIARALDDIAIDYIEGGWPGANPTDEKFFAEDPHFINSTFVAFGMTKRHGVSANNDPVLSAIINSKASAACLVAKSWDTQIQDALNVSLDDNLTMLEDSIRHMVAHKDECMIDAEHFFDGYISNPSYGREFIKTALKAGASWVVLCDTRGGMLPSNISHIIDDLQHHDIDVSKLGIHCHNDTDCAVANSLSAIEAGIRQVQCTINGLGERCGNANLISIIANLYFKYNDQYIIGDTAKHVDTLSRLSYILNERIGRAPYHQAAYVGKAAFAHKGGLHVSAIAKNPSHYEHINPEDVGNSRTIIMSDQAGKANMRSQIQKMNLTHVSDSMLNTILADIKEQEYKGLTFDGADASLDLYMRRMTHQMKEYFTIHRFRVIDERRHNANNDIITESEATIILIINDEHLPPSVAFGKGPVHALDVALRQALINVYPELHDIQLLDYKVRIINTQHHNNADSTASLTRVMIDSAAAGTTWTTVGVSTNIIDASMQALSDAYMYRLTHINI